MSEFKKLHEALILAVESIIVLLSTCYFLFIIHIFLNNLLLGSYENEAYKSSHHTDLEKVYNKNVKKVIN